MLRNIIAIYNQKNTLLNIKHRYQTHVLLAPKESSRKEPLDRMSQNSIKLRMNLI
jgi:hypothetical protein